jgi:hypothetical protein
MISNIVDILRVLIVFSAFFFGYLIGFRNGYNPVAQLHFTIPLLITAIAGISGLEGLLFGKKAAEAKGFEVGSNYQRQSAIASLSYAVISVIICFINWGIKAELAILFAFCFFYFFSAINHGVDAIRNKNYKWQNINRPFITLLLLAGLIYPVIMALKTI